jgi:protease I
MAGELSGTRVAFLTANEGVEQAELTAPWQAVKEAGGTPELIAPEAGDVQGFFEAGKPVAVICHGPWALVEADLVRGRTMTSWPSLATDIRNAGGTWVDAEVQVCTNGPNTLVTSRKPDDLPAFCEQVIQAFQHQGA